MSSIVRGSARVTLEVDISADDFYTMLRDWPSVMKWAEQGENAPAPVTDTVLKEGHRVDVLPCTRLCLIDTRLGHPPVFEETLLYADPQARRIFYTVTGFAPNTVRNYMATTFADEIGPQRARVTCWSMWDAPDQKTADDAQRFMEAVYERNVIKGIAAAVKREAAR